MLDRAEAPASRLASALLPVSRQQLGPQVSVPVPMLELAAEQVSRAQPARRVVTVPVDHRLELPRAALERRAGRFAPALLESRSFPVSAVPA